MAKNEFTKGGALPLGGIADKRAAASIPSENPHGSKMK